MYEQVEKPKENKSRVVTNSVTQKRSNGRKGFSFVDNRPEVIAQRKLQEKANNSSQAKQAAQLQAMADKHSAKRQHPIQKKENNTGLPDNLKSGIENLSGYSMDDVKVHYNSPKPAQLQAHAYAQGTDIHLASGQEKHLPHEAWHVVQQKQGRVKLTMQMKGNVDINDNAVLEREADVMGTKALEMRRSEKSALDFPTRFTYKETSPKHSLNNTIQRVLHGSVNPATGQRHDFETYILDYLNAYIAGLPLGHGLVAPAHGAAPAAIAGIPTWLPAIQAARILDTRHPREAANLDPNYGHPSTLLNAPVPGGAVVPGVPGGGAVNLSEMTLINTFVSFVSGGLGAGAGVSPGGQNNSVINWGALHRGFGTKVEANLYSGGEPKGSEPSGLGDHNAWHWMGRRKRADGTTLYAAGHLLHNLLGGPGLDYNLVPLTNDSSGAFGANNANLAHRQEVEGALLGAYQDLHGVGAGGRNISQVNYQVIANYTPGARPETAIVQGIANTYKAQLDGMAPGATHAMVMVGMVAALTAAGIPAPAQHLNDAMAAIASFGYTPATLAIIVWSALNFNGELWQEEDTYVPLQLDIQYNWVENGIPKAVRNRTIANDLPDSIRVPLG